MSTIEWHIADMEREIAFLKRRNGSKKAIEILEDSKMKAEQTREHLKKR